MDDPVFGCRRCGCDVIMQYNFLSLIMGLKFLGVVVGKLLEGFDQLRRAYGYERPLVHGQSSGVEASKSCRGNLQKSRKE